MCMGDRGCGSALFTISSKQAETTDGLASVSRKGLQKMDGKGHSHRKRSRKNLL